DPIARRPDELPAEHVIRQPESLFIIIEEMAIDERAEVNPVEEKFDARVAEMQRDVLGDMEIEAIDPRLRERILRGDAARVLAQLTGVDERKHRVALRGGEPREVKAGIIHATGDRNRVVGLAVAIEIVRVDPT